jgi:hypothetical protein
MDDAFKKLIDDRIKELHAAGVTAPCEEHGWLSMQLDGTCAACQKQDFPEDWKGCE